MKPTHIRFTDYISRWPPESMHPYAEELYKFDITIYIYTYIYKYMPLIESCYSVCKYGCMHIILL